MSLCNFLYSNFTLKFHLGASQTLIIHNGAVRHVTGTGSGLLGGIPRVVVQISALTLKGPL
jgi:hypothetical protein